MLDEGKTYKNNSDGDDESAKKKKYGKRKAGRDFKQFVNSKSDDLDEGKTYKNNSDGDDESAKKGKFSKRKAGRKFKQFVKDKSNELEESAELKQEILETKLQQIKDMAADITNNLTMVDVKKDPYIVMELERTMYNAMCSLDYYNARMDN